jgi:hypothetical protein
VEKTELARVVDPAALDSAPGARGRVRVVVPDAWAREQAEIEIVAPARVPCARCDGGGCDGCARSGALRTPGDAAARTLRVRLPERVGEGVALRLHHPFGEDAGIEQLVLTLVAGDEPSQGVSRLPAPAPPLVTLRHAPVVFMVLLALLSTITVLLATR